MARHLSAGTITTIGFCLAYITLFQLFSGIFVWFTVAASFILCATFTIFCFVKAGIINHDIVDKLSDALDIVGA